MLIARLLPHLAHDLVVGFVTNLEKSTILPNVLRISSSDHSIEYESLTEPSCACGSADCAVCEIASTFGT